MSLLDGLLVASEWSILSMAVGANGARLRQAS